MTQCARDGTTIPVRAGAGRIVSGRLSSELTSGEEGGGEDAGDEVWTEIDVDMAGGGVYADCYWLERWYLFLAWGLAIGARCGISTTISTSSSESSGSAGSRGGATRRRCLRGLVVGVYTWRRFPFRGDTRGVTGG